MRIVIRKNISEKAYIDYGFVKSCMTDYYYQTFENNNKLFINRRSREVILDIKSNSIDFFECLLKMYLDKVIEIEVSYD